jgi:hypothetical protein
VTLKEYLDRRDARLEARAARQLKWRMMLLERELDSRSLFAAGMATFDAKLLIAGTIIALFASAYLRESDKDTRNLMVGALIAAFAGAWGYYLGSSSGVGKANDRADKGLDLASDALNKLPGKEPDKMLKPGETAQAEPQSEGE